MVGRWVRWMGGCRWMGGWVLGKWTDGRTGWVGRGGSVGWFVGWLAGQLDGDW